MVRACDEHQNLPILRNVLISSGDNQISLTGTNLEIAIRYKVVGKVNQNGSVTVPASTLLNIINNIPTERINLEVKNGILEVKTDNYSAKIQTLPAEDFPLIPQIKNTEENISLETSVLKEALEQVVIATQFSELRAELNSVALILPTDSMILAATDSFRLAEKTLVSHQFKSTFNREISAIIPLKTIQELLRVIKDNQEISIYLDQNQILFKTEQFEFISRLLEGTFPDYKKVIPESYDAEAVLKKDEFMNAIKLTGVFSSKITEIKTRFINKKGVEIFSADESIGENSYLLPAKTKGEGEEVGFNWRYLSDGLKVVPGEEVVFGINKDNRPAVLRGINDPSYFYILMPILKT